ncbi:MAG: hypothetical protein EZS28_011095 [Streblomastix strix]|uniref:Uncharacterized protein n=1 Tax=Streblomastix strix TaxID=222440 RepID=A0A5J4WEI1_9EUKA|nr:MAG: hypothetical protein EZS28_011095 [Streblomastix strix]
MRPPSLAMIQYLLLRVFMNYKCLVPLHPVYFPMVSHPMWHDDSHVSQDRKVILNIAERVSLYFNQLHMHVHYGQSQYTHLNDQVLDGVISQRLSQKVNEQLLFSQSDCFLTSTPCDEASPNRIFEFPTPYFGLSPFISKTRMLISLMKERDASKYNVATNEIRYIASAIRYDMREGIDELTVSITDNGVSQVKQSQTIMIIVMIVTIVIILGTLIFNTLPWGFDMHSESDRSLKLVELLPIDENQKDMILLQSMRSGYIKMDQSRERIMIIGQQLIDTLKNSIYNKQQIKHQFDQLMATTLKVFQNEEKEMELRKYDESKTNSHSEMHLLLRQRLTFLSDILHKSGNFDSVRSTVRRTISRLFDKHFLENDLEFVEECIPSDERLGKTNGQDEQEGQQQLNQQQDGQQVNNDEEGILETTMD